MNEKRKPNVSSILCYLAKVYAAFSFFLIVPGFVSVVTGWSLWPLFVIGLVIAGIAYSLWVLGRILEKLPSADEKAKDLLGKHGGVFNKISLD